MSLTALQEVSQKASATPMQICILDNDPAVVETFQKMVTQLGFTSWGTSDRQEVIEQIANGKCPVVLCDAKLLRADGALATGRAAANGGAVTAKGAAVAKGAGANGAASRAAVTSANGTAAANGAAGANQAAAGGLNFLEQALQRDPGVYVIFVSDDYSIEAAVEAIKDGAYDYLPKPVEAARLSQTLADLDEQFQRRRRIHELERQLVSDLEFHGIVGHSPAMIELFELARKIARHDTNILLTGATGTGKELVAHAIHLMSASANRRFAVCNCYAMVDTLLESQLFGHVHGAFAGANEARQGLFEFADGGTIFLDQVSETSLALQAKLLRVIETHEIRRVGSNEACRVSVRLIASTNRDLRTEVEAGRFRADLFERLSIIQINVPSLIERLEDLPLLVAFFLKRYNQAYHKQIQGLTRRAQTALLQQAWPGNVRELENVISSAALVTSTDFIDLDDFPEHLRHSSGNGLSSESRKPLSLDEVRQEHIQHVLELCRGNRVRTAQVLGIGRTSLYRYLKRDGINGKGAGASAV